MRKKLLVFATLLSAAMAGAGMTLRPNGLLAQDSVPEEPGAGGEVVCGNGDRVCNDTSKCRAIRSCDSTGKNCVTFWICPSAYPLT